MRRRFGKSEAPPLSQNARVSGLFQKVLAKKEANLEQALDSKWDRYNPILIGGDLFTMGFTAFQGVQALVPATASISAIGFATLVCGEIAGVINIGVGIVSLKEGMQALKNGDKLLGARLLLDAVCMTLIGTLMILVSTAIKAGALAGIGAFFAANPWALPLLFFIVTMPLIVEIGIRVKRVASHEDLASKMHLPELANLLKKDIVDWEEVLELFTKDTGLQVEELFDKEKDAEIVQGLSERIETLQADMGALAALEAAKLLHSLMLEEKEVALQQLQKLQKRVAEWNHSLKVRFLQQMLYTASFGFSMIGLSPAGSKILEGVQDMVMAGANAIPLYMDSFWPFRRNTPIVVPMVLANEVA